MLGKLQNLLDKNLIAACTKQLEFSRYIGKHKANLDEQNCLMTFGDEIAFQVSVLGTESFITDTWTWAWADDHFKETTLIRSAQKLRKLGIKQELTLLSRKQCEIDTLVNGFTLATIACDIAKADCFYSFVSGDDERTYVLLTKIGRDSFESQLEEKDILKSFEQLMPNINFDHHASLKHACELAGLSQLVEAQKISIANADIIFDTLGNCLKINKQQSSIAESPVQTTTRKKRRSRARRS